MKKYSKIFIVLLLTLCHLAGAMEIDLPSVDFVDSLKNTITVSLETIARTQSPILQKIVETAQTGSPITIPWDINAHVFLKLISLHEMSSDALIYSLQEQSAKNGINQRETLRQLIAVMIFMLELEIKPLAKLAAQSIGRLITYEQWKGVRNNYPSQWNDYVVKHVFLLENLSEVTHIKLVDTLGESECNYLYFSESGSEVLKQAANNALSSDGAISSIRVQDLINPNLLVGSKVVAHSLFVNYQLRMNPLAAEYMLGQKNKEFLLIIAAGLATLNLKESFKVIDKMIKEKQD